MVTAMTTFYFLLSLLAPPRSQARADVPPLDPSITTVTNAFVKAVLAQDPAAVAAVYREDAVEMPFCASAIHGRAAIEQYYRELFRNQPKIIAFTLSPWEAAISGDVAYEAGAYEQTLSLSSSAPVKEIGKYTVILKRTSGVWKAAYAIYNRDVAPR